MGLGEVEGPELNATDKLLAQQVEVVEVVKIEGLYGCLRSAFLFIWRAAEG
jgi:hypothetical protein